MTPHKHHDLIVAWAKGATIQYLHDGKWYDGPDRSPSWSKTTEYRIKPVPKPDVVRYGCLDIDCSGRATARSNFFTGSAHRCDNLMVVFDGETGALKDVQLLARE